MTRRAVLACSLTAISATDRRRYRQLVNLLRGAIRGRSEIPAGYSFTLDRKAITLPEIREWIGLERLCCPFLTFRISSSSGNHGGYLLTLSGPAGVKAILDNEFPAPQAD